MSDAVNAPPIVCGECTHKNGPHTDYCVQCGAPLGAAGTGHGASSHWNVFGVPTPFVGRALELEQVLDAVDDARSQATVRGVVVSGREGSGKSRFLEVVNERLVARFPNALMPKCAARDATSPLDPLDQLLRDRFYVGPTSPDPDARIAGGIRSIVGEESGDLVARRVLAGLGRGDGAAPDVDDLADAFADVIRADCVRQPMVLAFDGIDQMSAETRRAVRAIGSRLTGLGIVLVATAQNASSDPVFGDVPLTQIALPPLSEAEIERVLQGLLARAGDVPRALIERVCDAAAGVPTVIEESVRILIRDGVVSTRGNNWTIDVARLDEVELPTEVEDAARGLMQRLTAVERDVLKDAALIGDTFWTSGLIALARLRCPDIEGDTGTVARQVQNTLDALLRRAVIREHALSALRGDREYAFKHRVHHRVHLGEWTEPAARVAHNHVAQWLQWRAVGDPERFLVAIADHYEAGGNRARSADFLVRAGRLCRDRHAVDRAIAHLSRALDLTDEQDLVGRADLLDDLGALYTTAGAPRAAISAFGASVRLAWSLCSERRHANALNRLGRAHIAVAEYDEALPILQRAQDQLEALDDVAGLASVLDDAGKIHWIRGQYDDAETRFRRALELRRTLGDDAALARSLSSIGSLLLHRGLFKAALDNFREALELRRTAGDLSGIAESLNAIGVVFMERGDIETAARVWSEAVSVAREAGHRGTEATALNNLGEAEVAMNRLEPAGEHLQAAMTLAQQSDDRRVIFDTTRNLGVLEARRGHLKRALEHGEEALSLAKSIRSRVMEGVALRTLGEIHGQTAFDDSDEDSGGAIAEAAFRSSLELFRQLENDAEAAKTLQAYGTYLVEHRQLIPGRRNLELAREIFARLELKRIVQQTDQTIASL